MDWTISIFYFLLLLAFCMKTFKPALYASVGWIVEIAVRAAEQEYKETKGKINRRAIAKEQIRGVLKWVGMNPDKWNAQIDWFMKAAITKLPKTPTFEDEEASTT